MVAPSSPPPPIATQAVKRQFELTPEIDLLPAGTRAREFESSVKAPRFMHQRS